MKSFLLTLGIVGFVVAVVTLFSPPTPPSPASPPLSEQDKAWQRLAAQVTPAQIEDMKRTARITGMEFKEVWGFALAAMACSANDPLLCPQNNKPSPTVDKTRVPCSLRSPGATYECWDEKTGKMRR